MKMRTLGFRIATGIAMLLALSITAMLAEAYHIRRFAAMAGEDATSTVITVAIAIALIVLLGSATVFVFIKMVRAHVRDLKDYSDKLARGETDFTAKAPLKDEFVPVYEAFDKIIAYNRENAELADAIAREDLSGKSVPRSEHDLLRISLNHLLKNNNKVVFGIKESSYQLNTGAEQVAAASQMLAQGSTEQASAIEQITVSMKEIETMTKTNASYADEANDIVIKTKAGAELGNQRMDQMKEAMNEINISSDKISKIIKVIDDISFQTNILALNAAVEAARAGSHGKGFAVVAEQIRELAGKSASAAAETAEMIDDSIRKVHNGTKLAEETAEALAQIMEYIDSVVDITVSIDKASNEQAAAVTQIEQAMEQVSQVVQTNSATSEECAAAAEELTGQANGLRRMVSQYKLDDSIAKMGYSANDKKDSFFDEEDPESIIALDGGFGKY